MISFEIWFCICNINIHQANTFDIFFENPRCVEFDLVHNWLWGGSEMLVSRSLNLSIDSTVGFAVYDVAVQYFLFSTKDMFSTTLNNICSKIEICCRYMIVVVETKKFQWSTWWNLLVSWKCKKLIVKINGIFPRVTFDISNLANGTLTNIWCYYIATFTISNVIKSCSITCSP